MIPPDISWADRPWVARTAWNAWGQGWFLISAVTSPFTSLPMMMVRPLNDAKPATTSAMLARSQVTVMRGSSALVSTSTRPATRTSGARAGAAATAGAAGAAAATASSVAESDDQAWND